MAATYYSSGNGDAERPWWKCWKGVAPGSAFDKMTAERLHPSSPLFYEALALEFLAREAHKQSKPLHEITREGMLHYLKTSNAHHVVEAHLPYVTPLTWVEKVIISEHTFAKMSVADQVATRTVFGANLSDCPGYEFGRTAVELREHQSIATRTEALLRLDLAADKEPRGRAACSDTAQAEDQDFFSSLPPPVPSEPRQRPWKPWLDKSHYCPGRWRAVQNAGPEQEVYTICGQALQPRSGQGRISLVLPGCRWLE
eukprot:s3207_g6.t1